MTETTIYAGLIKQAQKLCDGINNIYKLHDDGMISLSSYQDIILRDAYTALQKIRQEF